MKVKRHKRANRILTFFKYNYKIVPPFKVLVDGTFCMAALSNKINLREQLPKYLDGDVDILTTRCVLDELEKLGPVVYGALSICRQFEVAPCPHTPCRPAGDCLAHLARRAANKSATKFVISTQDTSLTDRLRAIVGTPILYIKYNAILLDKPSEATIAASNALTSEIEKVKELKNAVLGDDTPIKKKKKKVKGKNPLSCKKKIVKKEVVRSAVRTANGKRKRNKKKTSTTTEAS